jgi:hypothetical protein
VNDVELRDFIQQIALNYPAFRQPRITEDLNRQGW